MKSYRVSELARLSGVSVRTLHHYDAIGLLRPAFSGNNGYRYYEGKELLRLQQILIHRELGFSLSEIQTLLDDTKLDPLMLLKRQRKNLEEQLKRYALMLETIDRTIQKLSGDQKMKDEDLYTGLISPEKQAAYEHWLVEQFGPEAKGDIERTRSRIPQGRFSTAMPELAEIEQEIVQAMHQGVASDSSELDGILDRHNRWVSAAWGRECTPETYAGLADVYEHPDFRSRYESIQPGLTNYLTQAMRAWAMRSDRVVRDR